MSDPFGAFVLRAECRHTGEGPLHGLRFAVKDLFDVEGLPTTAGNPDWARSHPVPTRTAPVVARLLAAGADLVGKTHTDEIAFGLTGRSVHFGTPVNPAAPGRVPGGSSSGSAAAVAGGLVDFALGTDTAGSIRVPAAFCGLPGMRPTHGRIPLDGVVGLAPRFDTVGWLARDPAVLERVGSVLLGEVLQTDSTRGPLAIGVAEDLFEGIVPAVKEALQRALEGLQAHADLTALRLCDGQQADWSEAFRVLQGFDIWRTHGDWIKRCHPQFAPDVRARLAWAATVTPAQVSQGELVRVAAARRVREATEGGRLLCLPAAPDVALPRDFDASAMDGIRGAVMGLTCPAGLAGAAQVTLPAGTVQGCPVALSLMASPGADLRLLGAVCRLSASTPN